MGAAILFNQEALGQGEGLSEAWVRPNVYISETRTELQVISFVGWSVFFFSIS